MAVPELSVPVPRTVPVPVSKVTVPVGVPSPLAAETIAVNVSGWSAKGLGFEAETETVVVPWVIASLYADDVLVLKLVSPP